MIREVMGAVAKSLKSEFGYKIYSDEVARGFQTPCFFITPIITTSRVNKNLAERQLTVSLSYFSKDDKKNMMECAEIFQRIRFVPSRRYNRHTVHTHAEYRHGVGR